MALTVGDKAPEFELRSHRGGTVKLSDFRGKKNVVVAFHPLAFTPVCATQMTDYQAELPAFDAADTVVLGVSVDAQPAKSAWATELGTIDFDLLSDFHPHGEVARQFGVLRETTGSPSARCFSSTKPARSRSRRSMPSRSSRRSRIY